MFTKLEGLLGLSYESFSLKMKKEKTKQYHPEPNEENFSVFHNKNEFIFINDILSIIEFNNVNYLKEKYNILIKNRIEDNLVVLDKENIEWNIYNKYSYNKYLVIKISDYIYYEYEYEKGRFLLEKIRVSKNE